MEEQKQVDGKKKRISKERIFCSSSRSICTRRIKSRSAATDHALYDSTRGVQERLESNQTDAEPGTDAGLTAFGSDGFTINTLAQANTNAAIYIAWCWKAAGSTQSNTAGSITSTVSVNTTSGFSIMTHPSQTTSGTIGHALG